MRDALVLDPRHAEADGRVALDHRRARVLLREQDRGVDCVLVVSVALEHVPAGAGEAHHVVLADRLGRRAVVGHPVGVVEEDQLAEPQVPGEGDDLVADPLHQAAVADQRVGVVVDDVVAELGVEHRLGDRHPGGVGDPLSERAGGHLDAVRRFELGVPRSVRAQLAEGADLLDRERPVAGEVQQRVDQRRAVPVGLDEAVAVRPLRERRVELQVAVEQRRADVGGPQRGPGVAVAGARDGVHGEEADRVGHLLRSDGHGGVSFGAWHVRGASGVGRGLGAVPVATCRPVALVRRRSQARRRSRIIGAIPAQSRTMIRCKSGLLRGRRRGPALGRRTGGDKTMYA